MNILFWNTSNNANKDLLDECLVEIIQEKNCDIIVLAEYNGDVQQFCHSLNLALSEEYKPIPNNAGCDKIKGIIKNKYKIDILFEAHRYQISIIKTASFKLIVAMIHNYSKLHSSDEVQKELLKTFHQDICAQEEKHKTRNSFIVGDFNANPFEVSCISANSLHAIPFSDEVKKDERVVRGTAYQKFYNPTWKFFGLRDAPYSTYYYNKSDMINYYWNVYDQVVIRPQLIDAFDDDSLSIVTETKSHCLLKMKKPDRENYSDHLPLFCTLKEEVIK
ncbi:MAG: endonuclease/exonuclease/phosphatase family protein [Oscillospiraceae bacterium]|nr:endonuclease/exonuclease/phosphatase family protein [Oscillospiraceae bacterium]